MTPSSPGLAVELFGLPASGKTSLARAVSLAAGRQGERVRVADAPVSAAADVGVRLARKATAAGAELLRHPRGSAHLLAAVARSGQDDTRDAVALSVQWLVVQRLLDRRAVPGELRLLEEGVLQTLWSIGLRGDVAPVLAALGAGVRWPDVVVVVEAPLPQLQERLLRRESRHSRVQHLPPEHQAAELGRGLDLAGQLLAWWQGPAGPRTPLLRVGTGDEVPPGPGGPAKGLLRRLREEARRQPGPAGPAPRGRPGRTRTASRPG